MADYYPVLKRAISSLPAGSGEARRIVYEKARAALLKQLQSYDPPLTPGEITDQRLALEECIRRVESEVAGAAFGLAPAEAPVTAPSVAPPVAPASAPEAARPTPPAPAASPPPAAAEPERPPVNERASVRLPEPVPTAQVTRAGEPAPRPSAPEARTETKSAIGAEPRPAPASILSGPVTDVRASMPPPTPSVTVDSKIAGPKTPETDAKLGAGMSALASTLRQAEALGGASAQAVRSAREAIAEDEDEAPVPGASGRVGAGKGTAEKIEPGFMQVPLGQELPKEPPRVRSVEAPVLQPPKVPKRQHPRITIERHGPSPVKIGAALLGAAVLIGAGLFGYSQRDTIAGLVGDEPTPVAVAPLETPADPPAIDGEPTDTAEAPATDLEPKIVDRLPQEGEPSTPVAPDARQVQTETVGPVDTDMPPAPGTDVAAIDPPPVAPVTPDGGTPETAPPVALDGDAQAATPGATAAPDAATAEEPVVLVAQRAILYEEPIPGSEGSRVEGRVLWSYVNEPVLPGDPPVPQIRATIDIPDRDMRLIMSIRQNDDDGLPASHVVELKFELPEEFAGRTIDTTPGLILKQTEDARGDPLIGAVAKVLDNLFWLALSGADQDEARNVALLRERQWIDVPIRYGNRRRAILTFEKGTQGAEVFEQAFQAWTG